MENETQQGPQATLGGEPEPVGAVEVAVYVVQILREHRVWEDIATVEVAPRTRRKSVLEKALDGAPEHKPKVPDLPATYRVLDAQSFEAIPASLVPPEPAEPVLRIG